MADKKVKISVIVPVYNEIQYLGECVQSICNQIYENLEIILVDDGSSSPCYEMCDEYAKKDKRIRVIHKENGGSLSARRKGIEEATGDYVAFVDSDDWIEGELYQKIEECISQYDPDMVTASNYFRNYEDGHFIEVYNNKRVGCWKKSEFEKEVFPYFIKTDGFFDTEFPISMWAYLFKAKFARLVMQQVEDRVKTSEDYTFLMIAFLNAASFAAISYRGHHYRSNINSKTHTLNNMKELLYPAYETVSNAICQSSYEESCKEILRAKNRLHLYHALILKDYKSLLRSTDDFLFPYSKVKKGSRVLIYGAGKLGKQIYYAIKDSLEYNIVGIVDKNWQAYINQGIEVISPEAILSLEYDNIIIAISYINIREQVKMSLNEIGIDKSKIAEINLEILDEEHLPY